MHFALPRTAITHGRLFRFLTLCGALLLTFTTIPCFSQPVGNWTFTGSTNGTGGTFNTVSPADFSTAIPTKVYHGASEYYGEDGWPAGAADPAVYLQFTISPNTGYQLDLTSVILRIRRSTTGASGSGPTSWSLRSSLDGYTSNLGSNSLTTSYNDYTVNLGSGFLHVYTPVTFRLYGYNAIVSGGGGLSRLVLDNISIQGIGAVLPARVNNIQALRNNTNGIELKWQMSHVQAGTVFEVQRSTNGTDFTTVNNYKEKEYKATNSYTCSDQHVPAVFSKLYYRIQGIRPDGSSFLSPVVTVNNGTVTKPMIDHTSVQGESLITSLQVPEKGVYMLSVFSLNGVVLQQIKVDRQAGVHLVRLPLGSLAHGLYVIRLAGNGVTDSKKFIW
ncbi:T9SS type A sorting domain-containing protein [Longitalea arenae]|uniref:T9SS type A sorting domain-containing protein n=1 Tax=Longitalea arenae TaxID=2812558 RepID=UPI001967473E|nr:T9SS type A sorting domain-containing protein [Longitalea arenae]